MRSRVFGAACAALLVSGCGGGERQDADEPAGTYRVSIVDAEFPARQSIAEETEMRLVVRNDDSKTVPDIAVTVETEAPAGSGAAPGSFGQAITGGSQELANPERPIWIVDRRPRGGDTAYTNTWTLGKLAPGQEREFSWKLTAVKPGEYTVGYRVSPGLDGKARADATGRVEGDFDVNIQAKPVDSRVDENGDVVRGERAGER